MNFSFRDAGLPVALRRAYAGSRPNPGNASTVGKASPELGTFGAIFGDLVTTEEGEPLGSISDLWIDLASGRIDFAIVASGGFMGKGEQHFPVPWAALARRPQSCSFVIAVRKTDFLSAPSVDQATLASGVTEQLKSAIREHYGEEFIPSSWRVNASGR